MGDRRLLRRARCASGRDRRRDRRCVPCAREAAASRPGRSIGIRSRTVQVDHRGLRRPRRRTAPAQLRRGTRRHPCPARPHERPRDRRHHRQRPRRRHDRHARHGPTPDEPGTVTPARNPPPPRSSVDRRRDRGHDRRPRGRGADRAPAGRRTPTPKRDGSRRRPRSSSHRRATRCASPLPTARSCKYRNPSG